ncbi:MAG: hypothetical protein ABL986_18990 [Vicinamibacterales bacterium]
MGSTPTKPVLYLVPTPDGRPAIEDLVRLAIALTGRRPTAEEIARARTTLDDDDE